ncbi:MAG: ATP-binding protein, partial [Phycisphaerae bacterium]
SSDDAIISKTLEGVIVTWNAGAQRTFGYTADEIVGRSVLTLIPPDRHHEEPVILARLRAGERIDHYQTVRVRKDGGLIDVSLTVSPVKDASGRIIGVSKIARDVTELKRAMDERERLLAAERAARAEAERVSLMKDEFLATLSHELRTPLNAILGWAQILRAQPITDPDVDEGLTVIERNTRVQAQLIEDLLDMSRITSGKLRLDVQRVDLSDVVKAAVASVRQSAEARDIRLQIVLDPMAGPVRGDPNRLQQCFWNLLSNAIKFTPKGGRVQVALERVNSHLEVCVTDNGQGIRPEFLPHVFERFRQADASTTRRHGGLGLGLSIVKHLVELHGGRVEARSEGEGKGATFCIELPLMVADPAAPAGARQHPRGAPQAPMPMEHPSLDGVTVLAVDDEPDARNLLRRILEECGARVVLAASADEGLAAVRRERPNMIVSDIGMPGEDGYAFIRKVRQLSADEGGRTPAAAFTAFARAEDRMRALRAGFQTHVAKPVDAAELTAVVASLATRRNES